MPQDRPRRPDPAPRDGDPAPGPPDPAGLRLLVVPGVSPGRWLRVWQERLPDVPVTLVHATASEAAAALTAGDADAGLVRVPVDRTALHAIPLYTETTVVVLPTDHLLTVVEEVAPGDLVEEVLLVPDDDVLGWADPPGGAGAAPAPATTAQAVELVAAGVGLLVVPQSLARLHHRRDLTYRPVTDAPTSTVALAWPVGRDLDLVEELIGIVRGRTVNSSRGRATAASPPPAEGGRGQGAPAAPGGARGGRARAAGAPGSGARGRGHGPSRRGKGPGRAR